MRKVLIVLTALAPAAAVVTYGATKDTSYPETSVTKVVVDGAHGTAFYIGNGKFITAAHVAGLAAGNKGVVTLKNGDGEEVSATVDWADDKRDVAQLSATSPTAATKARLTCGVPDAPVGTSVRSIGFPLSLPKTETWGRIASKGFTDNMGQYVITSDLTIAPGNSGGPVFDDHDEVIGLSDAIFGNFALGLLVPRSAICAAMNETHTPPPVESKTSSLKRKHNGINRTN